MKQGNTVTKNTNDHVLKIPCVITGPLFSHIFKKNIEKLVKHEGKSCKRIPTQNNNISVLKTKDEGVKSNS